MKGKFRNTVYLILLVYYTGKILGDDHFDKIQYQFYLVTRYHLDMFAILLFALFSYYGKYQILLSFSNPE